MAAVRIDPRTKLFLFVSTSVFAMSSAERMPCFFLCSFLALLLFGAGQRVFALQGWLLYTFCLWILPSICRVMPGAAGTLLLSLVILFRLFVPIILALVLVFKTTQISEFMAAFEKLRVPSQIIIPVVIMFRFIPTVQEEWQSIRKAMAFRGISLDLWGIIRHPLQSMEYILIPLLISTVSIMDELAAASLARGLDSTGGQTSMAVVKMSTIDYAVILSGFIVILSFIK